MKNLIPFFAILILAGCSPKIAPTSSVDFIGQDAQGLASINATGFGSTQAEREFTAQKKVFESILFQGLPSASSSALRLPMIEKGENAKTDHTDFFQRFFEGKEMGRFVQSISPAGKAASGGQLFSMKINYDALRRHLESEGVIRKFGY